MARSFPPDVLVLDTDSLIHARLGRGRGNPQLTQAKSYSIRGAFTPAVVTPELTNEGALAETLKRLKMETGRWDKASLLLPDAWFRMNILDLPQLSDRRNEAEEMVRWSLKRTMPIDPTMLRIAYDVLTRTHSGARVLAVSAIEKTLGDIERVFAAAGIEVVLVEPVGLNIWNAIAVREPSSSNVDRLFFYIRQGDFTTAVFRGAQPLFIRSRNLAGDRSLQQEIRLSATYLRDTLQTSVIDSCWVAGNNVESGVTEAIRTEFSAPVKRIALGDVIERTPEGVSGFEAELTACTGVFAA